MTGFPAGGGTGWPIAIRLSRVGAYMVYIAYAAARERGEGDGAQHTRRGAWGWAFVSLGIAAIGAVVSVVLPQTTPGAAALRRNALRDSTTASISAR